MNKIKIALLTSAIALLISSCTTTEKFEINTLPNTEIYSPGQKQHPIATVPESGKAKISIPSDMYCGYMLVRPKESNVDIPLGLNYCHQGHFATKLCIGTGYTLTGIGGAAMIGGTIVLLASGDDEGVQESSGIVIGIAGASAGIGAALGVTAQSRLRQTAYDYNFGYDKVQNFEIPNLSTTILHPDPEKESLNSYTNTQSTRKKAFSGKDVEKTEEASSKAKKSRSDLAKNIEGTYIGNGKLLLGKTQDEFFTKISVILEKTDKNHVNVIVMDNDEEFFETPLAYIVSSDKQGGYKLTIENLPGATISISKTGNMVFTHSKVNIDNSIYTLSISAKKVK